MALPGPARAFLPMNLLDPYEALRGAEQPSSAIVSPSTEVISATAFLPMLRMPFAALGIGQAKS